MDKMALKNTYGPLVKKQREARELKAEYVARRLGVSRGTYSEIENGKRTLPAERLDRILDILGLSRAEFYENAKSL